MIEKDVAAFWRIFLQTEEILAFAKEMLGKDVLRFGNAEFWKGYLKALKDVGIEVLGIPKSRFESELDFNFKLGVARRLREKYPDAQIGFVCGAVHYTVEEIDALESVRNLF